MVRSRDDVRTSGCPGVWCALATLPKLKEDTMNVVELEVAHDIEAIAEATILELEQLLRNFEIADGGWAHQAPR